MIANRISKSMPSIATLRGLLRSLLLARARRYFNFFRRLLWRRAKYTNLISLVFDTGGLPASRTGRCLTRRRPTDQSIILPCDRIGRNITCTRPNPINGRKDDDSCARGSIFHPIRCVFLTLVMGFAAESHCLNCIGD